MDSHLYLCNHVLAAEPPGLANSESNFQIVHDSASKNESIQDPFSTTPETKAVYHLLDLYCGCGAMSTGICLGMNLAGTNLVTVTSTMRLHLQKKFMQNYFSLLFWFSGLIVLEALN